jgi:hypothetical protein
MAAVARPTGWRAIDRERHFQLRINAHKDAALRAATAPSRRGSCPMSGPGRVRATAVQRPDPWL